MTRKHKNLSWGNGNAKFHIDTLADSNAFTEPEHRPNQVTVQGLCPYCFGDVHFVQILQLVHSSPGGVLGQASGTKRLDITVRCDCVKHHRGRPAGEVGCGHSWVVTMEF